LAIDLETAQEIAQGFEKVKESVVARAYATGSLVSYASSGISVKGMYLMDVQ